jgi:hypothetical protein
MWICYYALKEIQAGDSVRLPGDLVPEATVWDRPGVYVEAGKIAPVLVATLPRNLQKYLEDWEAEQEMLKAMMSERDPNQPDEAPEDEEAPAEDEETAEEEVPSA